MKAAIKGFMKASGLWYPVNRWRNQPALKRWLANGCVGAAPHPVKMMIVEAYLKKHSIDQFVETGTYLGETVGYIARNKKVKCTSIELSSELYELACVQFQRCENVKLLNGDSGVMIPEVLKDLYKPAVFWLDGHYSGGVTASGEIGTPIRAELKAILGHSAAQHIILIDDARCFTGKDGYPHLDEVLAMIRETGQYNTEVTADIIRIVPNIFLKDG